MSARKTTKEKQAEAERKLQIGLSLSEQSADIAGEIINSLEAQKGQYFIFINLRLADPLTSTEKQMASIDNVEATEYVLQQSMRSLRGMTWRGWAYNMFTNEGKLQPASSTGSGDTTGRKRYSESSHECVGEGARSDSVLNQDSLSPQNDTKLKTQQQNDEIEKLANSVSRLQDISVSIGETLADHDEITDSLSDKTNDTNDYALTVTLRAAQLTQRSTGSRAVLLGEYKFRTLHNNYLSVFDDTITITPQFNRSTVFRVYVKENHLFAMQNMKTLKFLGLNMWGNVVVTSTGFGKNQEMHIDLGGEKTGIMFLNSNWGGGGWLKPDKDGFLRTVTSSLIDRDDRLLVTPLKITEADKKKLKNF